MAFLEWDASFETGVQAIDYEHRKLVDLLNAIDEDLRGGRPHAEIAGTLGEFHSLATAHLALEERFMRKIGDPQLAARRRRHDQLLDRVRDIMDGFEGGGFPGMAALSQALSDWLAELMDMDTAFFADMADETLSEWGLSRRAGVPLAPPRPGGTRPAL